jgi:leucyl-tRNA synthetase
MNHGMITLAGEEMSKSSGHYVEPRDVIDRYGVDALRVYVLFIGPPMDAYDWPAEGADAVTSGHRFVERVWRLVTDNIGVLRAAGSPAGSSDLRKQTHRSLATITERYDRFAFNTAIAEMMTLQRTLAGAAGSAPPEELREGVDVLLHTLAPIAPYVTEELWERLGNDASIHSRAWPEADPALAAEERVTMIVQVDSKVRDKIEVAADISEDDAKASALTSDKVQAALEGREPVRVIARPPRLVNVVTK